MNIINERLKALRKVMKKEGVDVYVTSTSDYHSSEYIQEYFKEVQFISGFTGSNGTVVVSKNEAVLYTDGRYFIQAAKELKGSEFILMKEGNSDVLDIHEYIEERLIDAINTKKKVCLGFDGRCVSAKVGQKYKEKYVNCKIKYDKNLIDLIWEDRPKLTFKKTFALDLKYAGESVDDKLKRVRNYMKQIDAGLYVLTSLDDIAWLFNIRGNDIPCNPVFFCYVVISLEEVWVYADAKLKINSKNKKQFIIKGYDEFYEDVVCIENEQIYLDTRKASYRLVRDLKSPTKKGNVLIDKLNITTLYKAVKNEVELDNTRQTHIMDGVAVTKFIYYLKKNIGKIPMTEISVSDYLEGLRRENSDFIELSFDTISAYKANAAMMHYEADENHNAKLAPKGFLLVDSGGHYNLGTTDITRTIALGKLTEKEKMFYTLALKGMLTLSAARFLHGCTGVNLDILARGSLWDIGMDYKCGTGHGVGHILNVHEAPNAFRWKTSPLGTKAEVLEAGMITTVEPGVYIENEFGIRIENELICKSLEKNEYGQFMGFETITFAPIEMEAVDTKYLEKKDIELLNAYNESVYEKISPYLNDDEKKWLRSVTKGV